MSYRRIYLGDVARPPAGLVGTQRNCWHFGGGGKTFNFRELPESRMGRAMARCNWHAPAVKIVGVRSRSHHDWKSTKRAVKGAKLAVHETPRLPTNPADGSQPEIDKGMLRACCPGALRTKGRKVASKKHAKVPLQRTGRQKGNK